MPGVARRLFGQADRADLRLAISGVGAAQAIERLHFLARHAPDGDQAFHRGCVRQLRQAGDDVADGVELGLGRFHVRVGVHEAALEFRRGFVHASVVGHRQAADGHQNFFRAQRFGFAGLIFEDDRRALRILLHAFRL